MNKFSKVFMLTAILYVLCIVLYCSASAEPLDGTEGVMVRPNYMQLIIEAAGNGDTYSGNYYTEIRNQLIEEQNLEYEQFTFEDFYLISKIITNEAGSYWLTPDHRVCVGNVALNRVESPEFPNTIKEVIEQPGQYVGANNSAFNKMVPYKWCCEAAARLFNGERLLPNSVVFQANFKQGSGTFIICKDPTGSLRNTYFCYSSYVNLY